MTNQMKLTIGVCCFISLLAVFLLSSKSTWVWHKYHLATMPNDLYVPIVFDHFEFHKKGSAGEFLLNPKYRDLYEVSIVSKNGIRTADLGGKENGFELDGEFKIELFSGSKKLSEAVITEWGSATFKDNDMMTYKAISLYNFPLPVQGFSINNIKLKITVVEADNALGAYKDDLDLQVGVSASP